MSGETTTVLSWWSSPADFKTAPEDALLKYCESVPWDAIETSRRRIADRVFLKQASSESLQLRYDNQLLAWELCNNSILRIPELIRWLKIKDKRGSPWGYLFMEYLPGTTIAAILKAAVKTTDELETICDKISNAIKHLHSTSLDKLERLGPLSGDVLIGFPWGESYALGEFSSVQDLAACLAYRMQIRPLRKATVSTSSFDFGEDLVLTHRNLDLKHIILLDDGTIGILNWDNLGNYPSIFELAALEWLFLRRETVEMAFKKQLVARLRTFIPEPDEECRKLGRVMGNSMGFSFSQKWKS